MWGLCVVCACILHMCVLLFTCVVFIVVYACIRMILYRNPGLISVVILEHCLHLSLETKLNYSASLVANDSPISASFHKDGVTVMFHHANLFT